MSLWGDITGAVSSVGDFVGDVVSGVGDAIGNVVEGVGDVVQTIVDKVVEPVMTTVENTIQAAIDDPAKAIATVAAVATGQVELLPLINAADTLAHGGDLNDALESAAISYASQGLGQYAGTLGDQAAAAAEYGTDFGSQQTAMLASQEAGLGSLGDVAGNVAGSTVAGVVRGADPLQALVSGGVSAGTSALTEQIPGFESMPKEAQRAANTAIAATLMGRDPSVSLVNAALNAGIQAAKENGANVPTDSGIQSQSTVEVPQPAIKPSLPPAAPTQDAGLASLDAGKTADNSADQTPPTDATDWAALYATPTTDASGNTIVGADPSQYPSQDVASASDDYWKEYQDRLKEIVEKGGHTAQWVDNEDGTKTLKNDDGSTLTVDQNGEVVGFTQATDTAYNPQASQSSKNATAGLGSLFSALSGSMLPGLIGAGVGYAASQDKSTVPDSQASPFQNFAMDWNQAPVDQSQNGIAYGQQFFDPRFKEVAAAQGGLMSLAQGGHLGGYSDGGRLLRGPGDGMSDSIPASIAQKQPARLADGEFVIPADVVSHLGNGSTDAGSRVLYDMMNRVRKARTGNPKQGKQINPKKFVPR